MYAYSTKVRCIFAAEWLYGCINEAGLSNELNDFSVVNYTYKDKALLFIFQRVNEKKYTKINRPYQRR